MKAVRDSRIWNQSFLIVALEGSEWSIPRPGRFTPRKDEEDGWTPEPVWTI
jgi:hypothetical protein